MLDAPTEEYQKKQATRAASAYLDMSGSHALSGAKMVHKGEAMPKRVSADVEMSLRKRIESGEWSESLRLPNERHLANECGVARNTVRAAIERIRAGGALRREVGRGTFLAGR